MTLLLLVLRSIYLILFFIYSYTQTSSAFKTIQLKTATLIYLALFLQCIPFGISAQSKKQAFVIGNHRAIFDQHGILQPWKPWSAIIKSEMEWYLKCPIEHGYPKFITMTFMDGNYNPDTSRHDMIPAMQDGMGIISYLKYYDFDGRRNKKILLWAKYMGDYLITECNTPDEGKYPKFTRSTGLAGVFPQPPDCGRQHDRPYEIEPDKGGIAGYALFLLYQETKEKKYLDQALHNAEVLASNMKTGDSLHSPWAFRVDYRTGEERMPISGNMVYILRLFDALNGSGHHEFLGPRQKLWDWILYNQLPSLEKDGILWNQFFEDHDEISTVNRTAWAPLNLARYLLEKKAEIDIDWRIHAKALIEFVIANFSGIRLGVPICGEQDTDKNPWGGILSTYGAVLAIYSAATGSNEYKALAWQALNFCLYAVNDDGCPSEQASYPGRGGWQEDSHTDKIHNLVDAMEAFPEWKSMPTTKLHQVK